MRILLAVILLALPIGVSLPPPMDFDCDGEITVNDALILVGHMDSFAYPDLYAYDLNRDGNVDIVDIMLVVGQIPSMSTGQPYYCPSPYPVPE